MRIGLRLFYNESWLGGVNYVLSIARMLRRLPSAERPFVAFLTAAPEAVDIARRHADLADAVFPVEEAGRLDLDFAFPATHLAEAAMGAPWGGWIPDWQCRHLPDFFDEAERARRFLQFRALAEGPVVCIFSSRQAEKDTDAAVGPASAGLRRVFHFPAAIAENAWARTPAEIGATRARLRIPDRYLIVCNQFWRHKNHLLIAKALARAPDLEVHVVMTGALEDHRWPDYGRAVTEALERLDVKRRVTLTGRIDRADQIDLMLGAEGYIQPSLFEGWSTFVEEARALGMPGLLSDIAVHREQAPHGAVFFDPTDEESLGDALRAFSRQSLPIDRDGARKSHEARVLVCGRSFLEIARAARRSYEPARHEAVAVYLAEARRIMSEQSAGKIARADADRFFASMRHALRTHPEDLARLSRLLDAEDPLRTVLVDASLSKMPDAFRRRYLAAMDEPERTEPSAARRSVWSDLAEKARGFLGRRR